MVNGRENSKKFLIKEKILLITKKIVNFFIALSAPVTMFMLFSWYVLFILPIGLPEGEIITNYLQLALTFFGFTLIGAIFEDRKNEDTNLVVNQLFRVSFGFLITVICYMVSYGSFVTNQNLGKNSFIFISSFRIGSLLFLVSILYFLYVLVSHYLGKMK